MQYIGLAVVVALFAALVAFVALQLLLGSAWLLGFVRGTLGLTILAFAGAIALAAYEFSNFRPVPDQAPLAVVTFQAQGPDVYEAVVQVGDDRQTVLIEGQRWQLHLRMLAWKHIADLIGLDAGYRPDALVGRYMTVEQQRLSRLEHADLAEHPFGLDVWAALGLSERNLLVLDPRELRHSYMPLADGASFAIERMSTGLVVEPLNDQATRALADW